MGKVPAYTYDEALFIFSITNLQYRIATAKSIAIAGMGGAGCWEMCYRSYHHSCSVWGCVTQSLSSVCVYVCGSKVGVVCVCVGGGQKSNSYLTVVSG